MEQIVKFFETGIAPLRPDETQEIFAFTEAAELSKQRHGAPVSLAEAREAAR